MWCSRVLSLSLNGNYRYKNLRSAHFVSQASAMCEICVTCRKSIPVANVTLHRLHCQRRCDPQPKASGGGMRPKVKPTPVRVHFFFVFSLKYYVFFSTAGTEVYTWKWTSSVENCSNFHIHLRTLREEMCVVNKKKWVHYSDSFSNRLDPPKDADDEAKLMEEFQRLDAVCSFNTCRTRVTLLRQQCTFCRRNFCLNHHMAEVVIIFDRALFQI